MKISWEHPIKEKEPKEQEPEQCRELPEIEIVQDVFEFLYDLEEENQDGQAQARDGGHIFKNPRPLREIIRQCFLHISAVLQFRILSDPNIFGGRKIWIRKNKPVTEFQVIFIRPVLS